MTPSCGQFSSRRLSHVEIVLLFHSSHFYNALVGNADGEGFQQQLFTDYAGR
jgi:hypothetical protein